MTALVPTGVHTEALGDLAAARAALAAPTGCVCTERTDRWFDRSICPEPCGSMHDICTECGHPKGGCAADAVRASKPNAMLDLVDVVLAAHAPVVDEDGFAWCGTCFADDAPVEEWSWPCRFHDAAVRAVTFWQS